MTYPNCMFADLTGSAYGMVKKLNCQPSNWMESNQIEYVGTSKSECSIKVKNVSKDDSGTWGAKIDSDVDFYKTTDSYKFINVTVVSHPSTYYET